jgi:hypothetical protein
MQLRLLESLRTMPKRDLRTLAGLLTDLVQTMGAGSESTGLMFEDVEA